MNPPEMDPGSEGPPSPDKSASPLTSHDHENGDANARVKQIKEEVLSIDVIDVALVGVCPAYRPRIDQLKAIAAILKLWLARNDYRLCPEGVAASEMSVELVIWNMPAFARRVSMSLLLPRMILPFARVLCRLRMFLAVRHSLIVGLLLCALFVLFFLFFFLR